MRKRLKECCTFVGLVCIEVVPVCHVRQVGRHDPAWTKGEPVMAAAEVPPGVAAELCALLLVPLFCQPIYLKPRCRNGLVTKDDLRVEVVVSCYWKKSMVQSHFTWSASQEVNLSESQLKELRCHAFIATPSGWLRVARTSRDKSALRSRA